MKTMLLQQFWPMDPSSFLFGVPGERFWNVLSFQKSCLLSFLDNESKVRRCIWWLGFCCQQKNTSTRKRVSVITFLFVFWETIESLARRAFTNPMLASVWSVSQVSWLSCYFTWFWQTFSELFVSLLNIKGPELYIYIIIVLTGPAVSKCLSEIIINTWILCLGLYFLVRKANRLCSHSCYFTARIGKRSSSIGWEGASEKLEKKQLTFFLFPVGFKITFNRNICFCLGVIFYHELWKYTKASLQ